MKQVTVLLILLIICTLATAGLVAAQRPAADLVALPSASTLTFLDIDSANAAGYDEREGEEQDFFYNGKEKVPLQIPLDHLGVLAQDGVDPEAIIDFARQFGLKPVKGYPDGILLFRLDEPVERGELNELARTLVHEGKKLIAQTGLVTFPEKSETPMLASNEFLVRLSRGTSEEELKELNAANDVVEIGADGTDRRLAVVEKPFDGLAMSQRYFESELFEYAHPNFVMVTDYRETTPNDPLYGNQWHHRNTGASGGTADADADTSWAWDLTLGVAANATIAVIDGGFDAGHPDLTPNLWANPGETVDGIDNDGNGKVDDVNGWDFTGCDTAMSPPSCGDSGLAGGNHGTAVAGVAAARGNNALGVSGACPRCGLMLIRRGSTAWAHGQALTYPWQEGAHILSNSWGYNVGIPIPANVQTAVNNAATNGRGNLGSVVLFAMNNGNRNDCIGATPDISSLANVIAVSASSNQDRKVTESAWGNCMDVLAPTHRGYGNVPYSGTLNITTTDRQGAAGYNTANPVSAPCPAETPLTDYTRCFGGTSAAAPLAAGTVGLMLSTNPGLPRLQAQRILQDTADKIQDSVGDYSDVTGFSTPSGGVASHGYGRINAYEAVRVAAPAGMGGRGNVDIFVRDNRLDWGNTSGYEGEQSSAVLFEPTRGWIAWYQSVDIKVDSPNGGYQPAPTTPAAFEAFVDESPESASLNKVYVRVRNRGQTTANSVTVKLHYAFAGTGLPALPSDFWTRFPNDSLVSTTQIIPVGTQAITNLAYSGASAAGSAGDAAQITAFDFNAPSFDPTQPNPDHYCLFVVTDSAQDRVNANGGTDFIVNSVVTNDNNVTLRNVDLIDTGRSREHLIRFFVRNPYPKPITAILGLDADEALKKGWKFDLDPLPFNKQFRMQAGEEVLVTMVVASPDEGMTAEIGITQFQLRGEERLPIGGLLYRFAPASWPNRQIYLPMIFRR